MKFPGNPKLRGNNAVFALVMGTFMISGWCPAVAESIPTLIEALTHDEARADIYGVRGRAAEALGNMDRSAVQTAIPALIKALKDEDKYVRILAAEALAKLGADDPLMVPAILHGLQSGNPHSVNALKIMGGKAVPGLKSLLKSNDPEVRSKSAWALEQINDPAVRQVGARERKAISRAAPEQEKPRGCRVPGGCGDVDGNKVCGAPLALLLSPAEGRQWSGGAGFAVNAKNESVISSEPLDISGENESIQFQDKEGNNLHTTKLDKKCLYTLTGIVIDQKVDGGYLVKYRLGGGSAFFRTKQVFSGQEALQSQDPKYAWLIGHYSYTGMDGFEHTVLKFKPYQAK